MGTVARGMDGGAADFAVSSVLLRWIGSGADVRSAGGV